MVTSERISAGQKRQAAEVIEAAARKAAEGSLEQLSDSGHWNTNTFQAVLAAGPRFMSRVAEVVKAELLQLATGIVGCLKFISMGEKIVIPATTGKRTIAKAEKVFPGYIDSDFVNYGCDVEGAPAPETPTEVYEMVEDGDFQKIFGGFGLNLDLLCFTQDQIIAWVEKNAKWLRADGYGTLFLFKVGTEFFVAGVNVFSGGLSVDVSQFSDDFVWYARVGHRFVFPQLTTSAT